MAQASLYYPAQFEDKVSLLPEQIDGNLKDHLLTNLRRKVEGKTTQYGIIIRVSGINDFWNGIIDGTNNSGTTVYSVRYDCFACSPIKGLEIVCSVDNVIKGYIVGHNGPVIIAISFETIDGQYFKTSGDDTVIENKTGRQIQIGDYLKVSIINIQSNLGEKKIVTICKLLDFASAVDIKSYEVDQNLIKGTEDSGQDKIFI